MLVYLNCIKNVKSQIVLVRQLSVDPFALCTCRDIAFGRSPRNSAMQSPFMYIQVFEVMYQERRRLPNGYRVCMKNSNGAREIGG